ncbi:hypothetical protein L6452_40530 [Arctium lappa]|uniref:Uncharacterized protein n=1 Tax=Arctium lappa TaxID=4217 RepID=A0ACB8XM52_ARCLA|nr:hypothetical protein L6452_40530 [Arctium lappa]
MEEMQEGNRNRNRRVEERIEEVKGRCECVRVYDQRCEDMFKRMEDMLKRMEEMQEEGNRRLEEKILDLAERGRLDDIKRWDDRSKRLEEMQDGMFRRLEEL